MKRLLLITLLSGLLFAKTYTLEEINQMPKSIAKDFCIWRFIQEKKCTKKEALQAYQQTLRQSPKLKKAIKKKLGYLPKKRPPQGGSLSKKDPKNFIIYPKNASKKSLKQLQHLYKKIKKKGKYSDVLAVMTHTQPFQALLKFPAKTQCYIFNGVTSRYREKHFNHPWSKSQLFFLSHERQFNKTIHQIVTHSGLKEVKNSLCFSPITPALNFKSRFLLAINALMQHDPAKARYYLQHAKESAKFQSQRDQCNFWFYLITQEKHYLDALLKSNQVNLYTLRARDLLHQPYPKVITPHLPFRLISDFNLHDPIDWERIKIKIKESNSTTIDQLANRYQSYHTEGVYSYLKEKATNYTKPYYPMPYLDAMIGKSPQRVALLYAIARQESRFVPASVSTSYALGMMQIMPFLIRHLAKERKVKLELEEMFNPYVAISYANQHLNYLNKYLYHPLFVAYAYNGGIGFTKKTIRRSYLFKKGAYEPYLSMERIAYEESKEYGKKVLANYVIYMNLLGIKTTISPLLEELSNPLATDKFR